MGKEAKTNAMRILERAKVAYTAHEYPHEEGVAVDGVTVAASIGEDPACVYKTLVTQGNSKNYFVFVIPVAAELDLKALQRKASKLSLAITELGPINAAAIEEYRAVKERSEFLRKQFEDLSTAKDNLEAVISEINSGMTKRFKEAFTQINVYFAQCYVKLFGGGTALLKLTEPDNILDSGIDIEVQPPGKKLQSLYLMSGGERALTVIALLFALLSYQPAPFCILDEIDAPLDDANIQRFANFLREFAAKTQFIMITHRKGTMEAADIMYGVTMEESGVSKLLSVKINAKES